MMNMKIVTRSSLGAILMGVGWSIGYMDPSSMIANMQFFTPHVLVYLVMYLIGQIISLGFVKLLKKCLKRRKITQRKGKRIN